jgi:hypothetical protein
MDSVKKRQEEATSKETLKDLENETVLDTDKTNDTNAVSPDGAFDEADELKDADPI